jgi:hypothetical protein
MSPEKHNVLKVYALTKAGRRQLRSEEAAWHATGIVARLFKIQEDAT